MGAKAAGKTLSLPLLDRYQLQRGPCYQFWMGIRFWGSGWNLFWRSPRLQLISLIPILLTAGLFASITVLSVSLTGQLLATLPTALPTWLVDLVEAISGGLVFFLITFLLFFPIMSVIAGPFREMLASHTETLLSQDHSEGELSGLAIFFDVIQLLLLQLVMLMAAFLVGWLVPGVGPFLSLVILIGLASIDLLDPALSVQGYRFSAKLHFLCQHRSLLLGFGLMSYVLLSLPLVNLLILPVATIGGTILVLAVLGQADDQKQGSEN
jgi:CysZ protein